ncbi:hypothetical protein AX660_02735 [Paraglaciecola hydrolytica]|uniref:Uncharacterized protein n=1 Tax=Paraglaciecola hydrolytica TaxID=1799789 RepID=A0A148KKA3_9ALTE|nr:hypothetical protein AX660_02735 [Paraglaciecola hydrolytica]
MDCKQELDKIGFVRQGLQSVRSKKPRNHLRGLLIMVPRPGIEPGTRGFSIWILVLLMIYCIDFIAFFLCDIVTNTCHKTKNRLTKNALGSTLIKG